MKGSYEVLRYSYPIPIPIAYRIRSSITTGLYFSKWVFGWGSIQKIPQKVDFLTKKWGSIQEKPQKQDFWKVFSRGEVIFKSGAVLERIRYLISRAHFVTSFWIFFPGFVYCVFVTFASTLVVWHWCLFPLEIPHSSTKTSVDTIANALWSDNY